MWLEWAVWVSRWAVGSGCGGSVKGNSGGCWRYNFTALFVPAPSLLLLLPSPPAPSSHHLHSPYLFNFMAQICECFLSNPSPGLPLSVHIFYPIYRIPTPITQDFERKDLRGLTERCCDIFSNQILIFNLKRKHCCPPVHEKGDDRGTAMLSNQIQKWAIFLGWRLHSKTTTVQNDVEYDCQADVDIKANRWVTKNTDFELNNLWVLQLRGLYCFTGTTRSTCGHMPG